MKKVIFLSVVWTSILLGIVSFTLTQSPQPIDNRPHAKAPSWTSSPVVVGTGIVLLIFAADVLILWILSKIGGPLKADVKATIKKFGGSLAIAGVGLFGCFLAIAFTAFAGIYLISKLMGQ
jgi:hypothetical protein